MKAYIFRLDPVLKVRKLKEETCRMELGRLITELDRINNQLSHDRKEVDNYFTIQEAALKSGVRGDQVQAFPMLVAGKDRNIQLLERDRKLQEEQIEIKKHELAVLRGELKVIENLKEKDYTEYRKAVNKETDQKVEEQTQNWLNHKERKV
ncbi:MAG: flagellar export protein FliJ [Bdellovibrionales bacterium]|nr:flagellar export protein FliJ [Bdellovibrionales bacterium]